MRKELKNTKAITLIALIVTIVVLLIIAGVSLTLVLNSNGIIVKAKSATNDYNAGAAKEGIHMVLSDFQMARLNNSGLNIESFLEDQKTKKNIDDYYVDDENNNHIYIYKNGYQIISDRDGNIVDEIKVAEPRIVVGKINITKDGTTEIADGTLTPTETVQINFAPTIKDSKITNVSPSLPYTTAQNEYEKTFHITATYEEKNYTKDVKVSVASKYNQQSIKLAQNGFGNASEGEITSGKTVTVSNNADIAKIVCSSFNLPTGQTLTVSKPCAGLYIYSQGDITINGTIDMRGKGYYTESVPSYVTVSSNNISLAIAGVGGSSRSGDGGCTSSGGVSGNGYGGSGATATGTAGNHTCGGYGNKQRTCGGTGGRTSGYNSSHGNGSSAAAITETAHCNNGAGAIVLIAGGNVTINGTIISTGTNSTICGGNGSNGSTGSWGGSTYSELGGDGGMSGTGGDGGGALTVIYRGVYKNNGTINLSGGASAGNGTSGTQFYSSTKWWAAGGSGGTSGAGGSGNIITKQVTIPQ